jgi:hypothetical protein
VGGGVRTEECSFLKERTKKLLQIAGGNSLNAGRRTLASMGKSFLLLFFKKEVLPS